MPKSKLRLKMGELEWAEYQRIKQEIRWRIYRSGDKVTRWRQKTKMKLIEYKGGKCVVCGYDKPVPAAFDFHHRNPEDKDFTISGGGRVRAYDKLKKEADKCDLMCCRCHAEKHHEEYVKIRNITLDSLDERIEKLKILRREILAKHGISVRGESTGCKVCGNKFRPAADGQLTCSKTCYSAMRVNSRKCKNRPSKDELQSLISSLPWTHIGRMFSVTDNTIRKWARGYGIIP